MFYRNAPLVPHRQRKVTHVWNIMRVSKWRQDVHFWWTILSQINETLWVTAVEGPTRFLLDLISPPFQGQTLLVINVRLCLCYERWCLCSPSPSILRWAMAGPVLIASELFIKAVLMAPSSHIQESSFHKCLSMESTKIVSGHDSQLSMMQSRRARLIFKWILIWSCKCDLKCLQN